jgi:hypothetical protein
MSFVQRLFTRLLPPKWAADMEVDSRAWILKCKCGYERSFWDIGGIRWKAFGSPSIFGRCPNCGKRNWHSVYHKPHSA